MFTNILTMKMRFKNILFAFVALLILTSAHFLSDELDLDKIKAKLQQFDAKYPYQQIYLQTDREFFAANETMWLKAYVRRGADLLPDTLSVNLYIDIVNWQNKIVMSKLLRIKQGIAIGDFTFPNSMPDGNYTLRAFTNSMRNFDDDYFFSKEIRVSNPDPQFFTMAQYQAMKLKNKKTKRLDEKYDIQFMPEGGDLLADKGCVLAFKAINQLQQGIEVEGELIDDKGKQVATFASSHLGMGKLTFAPQKGRKYKAKVRFADKKSKTFDLPDIKQQGFALQLNNSEARFLEVRVTSNLPASLDKAVSDFYILIQNAGKLLYSKKESAEKGEVVLKIDKETLGQGVNQITIVNARFEPECERLFYIDKGDDLSIQLSGLKNSYKTREKVEIEINTAENSALKNVANLAVSVANVESLDLNYQTNIKSYFDLKSKLIGKVENIANYFDSENTQRYEQLDLLLLTQAWRRYEWNQILNDTTRVKHTEDNAISVGGYITRDLFGIPLPNIEVQMSILNNYNEEFTTKTNRKGQFLFTNLNYPDTMVVLIEARKESGKKNLVIYLNIDSVLVKNYNFSAEVTPEIYATKGRKQTRVVFPDPSVRVYEEGEPHTNSLHSNPDQIIYMDKINYSPIGNLEEVIKQYVPGFYGSGATANFRGINSIMGSSQPLLLIDDVMVDYSVIFSIAVNDVHRIEILKGASASIYGLRGSTGAIAVYTKQGRYMKRGEISFNMLGYATPKQFYSPKYTSTESEKADLRKTLYWNPQLITDKKGVARFSFYTSDLTGTFTLKIEGMDSKGKVGFATTNIVVEK